jgi:hypothetical protein
MNTTRRTESVSEGTDSPSPANAASANLCSRWTARDCRTRLYSRETKYSASRRLRSPSARLSSRCDWHELLNQLPAGWDRAPRSRGSLGMKDCGGAQEQFELSEIVIVSLSRWRMLSFQEIIRMVFTHFSYRLQESKVHFQNMWGRPSICFLFT